MNVREDTRRSVPGIFPDLPEADALFQTHVCEREEIQDFSREYTEFTLFLSSNPFSNLSVDIHDCPRASTEQNHRHLRRRNGHGPGHKLSY